MIPFNYQEFDEVISCYRSDQLSEEMWQRHLRDDPIFKNYVESKMGTELAVEIRNAMYKELDSYRYAYRLKFYIPIIKMHPKVVRELMKGYPHDSINILHHSSGQMKFQGADVLETTEVDRYQIIVGVREVQD